MKYIWCLHCERTYKFNENYVRDFSVRGCPHCGASYFLDGWEWDRIREIHPHYPEVPVEGEEYPMY